MVENNTTTTTNNNNNNNNNNTITTNNNVNTTTNNNINTTTTTTTNNNNANNNNNRYLADWLAGNGCVALPATVEGVAVRVMDDLATTERSRWEVWHELRHGRFPLPAFLRIVHEEVLFVRQDSKDGTKAVQVRALFC